MRMMVLILALLAAFRTTSATAGPATLLADGWRQYKDHFLTSEGRIVDNANGGCQPQRGARLCDANC